MVLATPKVVAYGVAADAVDPSDALFDADALHSVHGPQQVKVRGVVTPREDVRLLRRAARSAAVARAGRAVAWDGSGCAASR